MKVSVITVCRNSAPTIGECISSVSNQTYSCIEHIVIDGQSTDGTLDVLFKNRSKFSCFVSEGDQGIYDALNKGISLAEGEIIGILNADDQFSHPEVLHLVVDFFLKNPSAEIVSGNTLFFNPGKNGVPVREYVSKNFKPFMLRFGFMPAHTATFVKRSLYDRVGLYDPKFKSAGDFDFFLRVVVKYAVPLYYIDSTLVHMLTGGASTSGFSSYDRTSKEILMSLKKNNVRSHKVLVASRLVVKLLDCWNFRIKQLLSNFTNDSKKFS